MAYPISDVPRRIVYSGSAGVGPYAFTFEVLANTDIAVYKNTTLLTLTTDYAVTINAGTGTGTVTLVVAATGSDTVTLVGDRAIQRTSDFVTGGDLFANTLNEELDAQTIYAQQIDEKADRAIRAPVTDPTTINMVLPSKADRATKMLGFNAQGNPTQTANTLTAIDAAATAINEIAAAPAGNAAGISFLQAGTNAVTRTAQAKMREWVSPEDFGAVGNANISGTSGINDDAAFALLEAAHTDKVVNLEGKIYLVNSPIPTANNYINGKFVVAAASTDDQPVNFAFGYGALRVNDYVPLQWPAGGGIDYASGNYNTAIGDSALQSNTTGRRNTALGSFALYTNTTGYYNTAIGPLALYANTSGGENTAVGVQAHQSNTTGSDNTVVGSGAMAQHSTSNDCVVVGRQALQIAPASTARVVAIGRQAAWQYNTGVDTVAIGYQALSNAGAVGSYNIAIGSAAMGAATSANSNVAIGRRALSASAASVGCVAVGNDAMVSATGGDGTVAIGNSANPNNTTGSNNVFIGANSATANNTGYSNVAIGRATFQANTTGYNNVAIGEQTATTNTTGFRNTWVGSGAGTSGTTYAETVCLGYNAQVTGNYQNQIGGSGTTTYAYGAVQDRSDARDKADVRDTVLGLEFINALRPVDYRWDMREDYRSAPPAPPAPDASDDKKAAHVEAMQTWVEANKLGKLTHDGSKKRARFHHGLIAQEVRSACEAVGVDFGGFQDHSLKGGDDVLSLGYAELIGPLIKAVQELSARVAALEAK